MNHQSNNTGAFLLAVILGAIAVLASSEIHAIEADTQKHVGVSFALGVASSFVTAETRHPVIYGALLATAPGVLKEVYDAQHPDRHTASVGDLTADLVGAFAGAWVGPQLHLRVHARRTEVIFSRSF